MASLPTKDEFLTEGIGARVITDPTICSICLENLPTEDDREANQSTSPSQTTTTIPTEATPHHPTPETNSNPLAPTVDNNSEREDGEYQTVQIKACGQVFGISCLKQWFRGQNTCPLCRTRLFQLPFSCCDIHEPGSLHSHRHLVLRTVGVNIEITPGGAHGDPRELGEIYEHIERGIQAFRTRMQTPESNFERFLAHVNRRVYERYGRDVDDLELLFMMNLFPHGTRR